jgi:thiol-disulfide isomerase/thioredoxin
MKKAAVVILGVASIFLLLLARAEDEETTRVKNDRLTFSFPDLRGRIVKHDDSQFKSKVVIVDIWGSWCGPCREEIPFLMKLHEKYREDGLEIVGIAFEKTGDDREKLRNLKKFVEENGIKYTVLFGGSTVAARGKLQSLENFQAYPTTIFIDRAGKARKVEVGFSKSAAAEMEKTVVELLKERS